MAQVLAQQLKLRTVDLDQAQLPENVTDYLRLDLAERYGVFPLGVDAQGHTLFLATSDPTNVEHIQELEFATNMKLELVVATSSSIDRAIRKYYFGENVVPTPTIRPQDLGVNETTFELDELLGEASSAPPSQPGLQQTAPAAPSPAPAVPGELAALKHEMAVLREQVQAQEAIATSQVRALRVLLEILIESGLVTREEYLEHLHRPE
jgi:type IV pilus assembly protein PilB